MTKRTRQAEKLVVLLAENLDGRRGRGRVGVGLGDEKNVAARSALGWKQREMGLIRLWANEIQRQMLAICTPEKPLGNILSGEIPPRQRLVIRPRGLGIGSPIF